MLGFNKVCMVPYYHLLPKRKRINVKVSCAHDVYKLQEIVQGSFGTETLVHIQTVSGYVYMYIETGVHNTEKCTKSFEEVIEFLNRWRCYQYLYTSLHSNAYDRISPTSYRIPLGIGFYSVDPSNGF